MDKHRSHGVQSWFDSLKHRSSRSEKPSVPTHVKQEHLLDPLFAPMNAKMAILNKENGLGDLSTSKPLILHLKGDMSEDGYNTCSNLMDALLHVITDAIIQQSNTSQTPITNTINNVELWVEAFRHFPLPVITGPEEFHRLYSKENFTLDGSKEFIEDMIDIKGIEGLADSVIEAAKEASQQLKYLSKQEKEFTYFGIIFGYFEQYICIRLIKFVMNMKETDTIALCQDKRPTSLNCEYYNYHFSGDTGLILQVARNMQIPERPMIKNFREVAQGKQARLLITFLEHHFPLLLAHWLDSLTDFLKSKANKVPASFRAAKQEIPATISPKSDPNLEHAKGGGPNLTNPNNKQYRLCLQIVEKFWDQQSTDGKTIKFNYMDGTCTEKQISEYDITCQLDRQNSFTDKTGKTFVSYQLKCASNSFACVLIQIPGKGQSGIFAYDLPRVKKAFNDSLKKQEVVELGVDSGI